MIPPRLTSPDLAWRGAQMGRNDLASSPAPKAGEVEVDPAVENRRIEEKVLRRGQMPRLTGRLGTYVGDSPDGKWRLVSIPGIGAPRHFPADQLEVAE